MKKLLLFSLMTAALAAMTLPASARGGGGFRGHGGYHGGYHGGRGHWGGSRISIGIGGFFPGYYGGYYGPGYSTTYVREVPVYQGRAVGGSLEVDVQAALRRQGFYRGAVDGIIGPESREAIRAYQYDRGLSATGRIDTPLLRSLGL